MAGDSTSTVKSMNSHPLKIDVVKFDGKNNLGMWWRCEVMDALTVQILKTLYGWRKSVILLQKRIEIR